MQKMAGGERVPLILYDFLANTYGRRNRDEAREANARFEADRKRREELGITIGPIREELLKDAMAEMRTQELIWEFGG
jgi:elongation factor P--beta-lysine ligase